MMHKKFLTLGFCLVVILSMFSISSCGPSRDKNGNKNTEKSYTNSQNTDTNQTSDDSQNADTNQPPDDDLLKSFQEENRKFLVTVGNINENQIHGQVSGVLAAICGVGTVRSLTRDDIIYLEFSAASDKGKFTCKDTDGAVNFKYTAKNEQNGLILKVTVESYKIPSQKDAYWNTKYENATTKSLENMPMYVNHELSQIDAIIGAFGDEIKNITTYDFANKKLSVGNESEEFKNIHNFAHIIGPANYLQFVRRR